MGHSQVRRAYQEVLRSPLVPHHRLLADRWTGVLHLRWRIGREHPLAVGAGWFTLRGGEPPPERPSYGPRRMQPQRPAAVEVVAEIVRRGVEGTPVIPGSSVKGAVRQVYELLTPSCSWWTREGCSARPRDREPQLCPACSLFGARGVGGRAAFGEARPAAADWSGKLAVRKVPAAWPPRRGEEGTVRVYDRRKAVTRDGRPAPDAESSWTIWGDFDGEVRLVNASNEELGLLFGALGLGGPSPMLRLGGRKYDGFGSADVELRRSIQSYPERKVFESTETQSWAEDLTRRAVAGVEERRAAWEEIHTVMSQE